MLKLLLLLCFPLVLQAQTRGVKENDLLEMAKKGSPQLDQIEATFLMAETRNLQTKENYSPELFGEARYSETNERALIPFQPIFSPIAQAQLGVRQNLSHGLSTSASIVTDQRDAGPTAFTGRFKNVTTTTLKFTVQMDIWKNLFGRMSKAELENAQFQSRRAEIEKEIQQKTFEIALRRTFWSLVANQEALKISDGLLATSKKQLAESNLRFRNAVAEADEVARFKALVATREGQSVYLQYQRETLVKQLKNLLPELGQKDLVMDGYDIQKTIDEVMACTATIATQPQTPYEFTKYDEAVALLRNEKANAEILNSRYSGPDVNLFGTAKTTGVGSDPSGNGFRGSYGAAREDIENNNRTGYEVGVNFVIPLGDAKSQTAEVKKQYDQKRLNALIVSNDAQINNTHFQLVKSISHLNEVNRAQKVSTEQLNRRLQLMQKKYQQARVSVNDVINDQDALLNAELTTIDTRLAILNTIFDYLVVFTETPCTLNRK